MSTAVVTQPVSRTRSLALLARGYLQPMALISLLTLLALPVHGYHPFSEDGGVYAAGIKHLLRPELYPYSLPFVEAHLRFSLFAPAVASFVRLTHLSLEAALLALYLGGLWLTLFAVWMLAGRCFTGSAARSGAVLLFAAWLTTPVAGTSIILVDPYLTARSLSLPCTLLALAFGLDLLRPDALPGDRLRSAMACFVALIVAAAVHPLMAAYALADLLLLAAILSPLRRGLVPALCLAAFAAAGVLRLSTPPASADYTQAALSRTYWFLSEWQWYEIIGIIVPLLLLLPVANPRRRLLTPRQALASMAILSGIVAIALSLAFAHTNSVSYAVARLQPLRAFQMVYCVMILFLGAALGKHLLKDKPWRMAAAFLLLAAPLFIAQQNTYPSSAHIEWPGATPRNAWQQAFLWIRAQTPLDALFALDADYISLDGEDAQCFRALAERSALPDFSKDGGETAITLGLSAAWAAGQRAQHNLSAEDDAHRIATLRPLRVTWLVLQQKAATGLPCPYSNAQVKVCRLP